MKHLLSLIALILILSSCGNEPKPETEPLAIAPKPIVKEYGFNTEEYEFVRDTVKSGDTFGTILDAHGVPAQTVFNITNSVKETFNPARIGIGRPYAILKSKDTSQTAQAFIYENDKVDYTVVNFSDSIGAYKGQKKLTVLEKEATGIINSSLSKTMEDSGLSVVLAYKMADVYAWTIDFLRLQEGDRFKVIYEEKYINDTIYAELGSVKAVYFEHRGEPFYAFNFKHDSIIGQREYYDEEANNLRRAFLKAPVQFSRISSRFNLKRRIKYYGYKLRPHRGTDYAASVGTPILATADGVVTKSEYRGGNGNYVKLRHNSTYETQYLHMKKRKVNVGQYVKQGDVIGWVGMTGNTGGPHVCYRFWKNGVQVDPLKQDLPSAEPLEEALRTEYFMHIDDLKRRLDALEFKEENTNIIAKL